MQREVINSCHYSLHFTIQYANTVSYQDEFKQMLLENKTFTNWNVEHNHQNRHFLLEGKINRHRMVARKGQISADTLRNNSQEIAETEIICK